jgi:hypothetical protein
VLVAFSIFVSMRRLWEEGREGWFNQSFKQTNIKEEIVGNELEAHVQYRGPEECGWPYEAEGSSEDGKGR